MMMMMIGLVKLQQMIERVGKPWWTWQWRAHLITLMQYQQEHFKKCWTIHWQWWWWPLFLENEDTWQRSEIKGKTSESHWRINPKLDYCVFTHPSLGSNEHLVFSTWYTLQGLQEHTANDAAIKKKRLLLKNCSETEQPSILMMKFDTERIVIWPTASHTLHFNLYVAEANNIRISTRRNPNKHTRRNLRPVPKKNNFIYGKLYDNPQLLRGNRFLQQCPSVTVSSGCTSSITCRCMANGSNVCCCLWLR